MFKTTSRAMHRRPAFTLLELLVVVAILAVLFALTFGAVQRVRLAALEAERLNWLHQRALGATVQRQLPIKILFIGNSYTEVNDLPGTLVALSRAANTRPELIVERQLVGGTKLKDHWNAGIALQKINADKWDFVVLQEQSQTPLEQFGRDTNFYPYARLFATAIRERGAIPLFFMTWSRPDTPGPQQLWTDSYVNITKELSAEVAPAGMAWEQALIGLPQLQMYADQGGHPTPAGTYLVACTFYATIYAKTPEGLPNSVTTPTGTVGVSASDALAMQRYAWNALKAVKPRITPAWR